MQKVFRAPLKLGYVTVLVVSIAFCKTVYAAKLASLLAVNVSRVGFGASDLLGRQAQWMLEGMQQYFIAA